MYDDLTATMVLRLLARGTRIRRIHALEGLHDNRYVEHLYTIAAAQSDIEI